MDSATPSHRKIELQSTEDLNYLITNAKHAARARIDAYYPVSESGDGATTSGKSSVAGARKKGQEADREQDDGEELMLRKRRRIEDAVDAVSGSSVQKSVVFGIYISLMVHLCVEYILYFKLLNVMDGFILAQRIFIRIGNL